ncbi:MAG: hypothetical protein RJA70_2510, partial [Pseudomonadota bacterium]
MRGRITATISLLVACACGSEPTTGPGAAGGDAGDRDGHAEPGDDQADDQEAERHDASDGATGKPPNQQLADDSGVRLTDAGDSPPIETDAGSGDHPDDGRCNAATDCDLPLTVPANCAEAVCEGGECHFISQDADQDSFGASRCTSRSPGISVKLGEDCNDADALVNPNGWDGPAGDGFADGCNDEIDQDCNGQFDDGQLASGATCACTPGETGSCATTVAGKAIEYPGLEAGRPVGACQFGTRECLPNGTWGTCNGAVGPSQETCDGDDNDCDSIASVQDEDVVDKVTFVCDGDQDDHLSATNATTVVSCSTPTSDCEGGQWLANPSPAAFDDCDDTDAQRNPDEAEVCNNKDDNCDGDTDESGALGEKYWSYDADGDEYRDQTLPTYFQCHAPLTAPIGCAGTCPANAWVDRTVSPLPTNDCDDAAQTRNPGATDLCNGTDQDCDGSPLTGCACANGDEQSCSAHPEDGVGPCQAGTQTCSGGAYGACVDSVGPSAEVCGLADLNCDGTIGNLDAAAADKNVWVCDADQDGRLAVAGAVEVESCLVPASGACNAGNGDWIKEP